MSVTMPHTESNLEKNNLLSAVKRIGKSLAEFTHYDHKEKDEIAVVNKLYISKCEELKKLREENESLKAEL